VHGSMGSETLAESNSRFDIRDSTGSLVEGKGENLNRKILENLISELKDLILEDLILFVVI
jgi:hypothetical protein